MHIRLHRHDLSEDQAVEAVKVLTNEFPNDVLVLDTSPQKPLSRVVVDTVVLKMPPRLSRDTCA